MTREDLLDLMKDVYKAYSEVYSKDKIKYYEILEVNKEDIYHEDEPKYKAPINLLGLIKFNPSLEEISEIGQQNNVKLILNIPTFELMTKKLISWDNKYKDLLKGKISIDNVDYNIINVIPKENIGEGHLTYSIELKEV